MLRIEKIIPVFDGIITTSNTYPSDFVNEKGFVDPTKAGKLKEYQTIIAAGPVAESQGFKPGMIVFLNYIKYTARKHQNANFDKEANIQYTECVDVIDVPSLPVYNKETDSIDIVLRLYASDVLLVVEGTELPDKVFEGKNETTNV